MFKYDTIHVEYDVTILQLLRSRGGAISLQEKGVF